MRLIPLSEAYKKLGYDLGRGQLIFASRNLGRMGYKLEKIYHEQRKSQLSHIPDTVAEDDLLAAIRGLRRVTVVQSAEPEKLPKATVEERRPTIGTVMDEFFQGLFQAVHDHASSTEKIASILLSMNDTIAGMQSTRREEKPAAELVPNPLMEVLRHPPKSSSMEDWAAFLENLAGYLPESVVPYMEAAEVLRTPPPERVPDNLPTTAVWRGDRWVSLVYTDHFLRDWNNLLSENDRKAVLTMMSQLTQNPYYPSLATKRRYARAQNPPGTDEHSLYSRASNTVRVWWSQKGPDVLEFQRVVVKGG